MADRDLNQMLKKMEAESQLQTEGDTERLDDTQRVKVLSPGRLVFKRFIRNRLAIVGSCILVFMFVFCFVGPYLYPYGQTDKFYITDIFENSNYAAAKERTEYSNYEIDESVSVHYLVTNMMNYFINEMKAADLDIMLVKDDFGEKYIIKYEADNIYSLNESDLTRVGLLASALLVCEYDMFTQTITYSEGVEMDDAFGMAVRLAVMDREGEFVYGGKTYKVESAGGKKYAIWHHLDAGLQYITQSPGEGFEAAVEAALDGDKRIFEFGGSQYLIDQTGSDSYDIYRYAIRKMLYVCSPYTVDLYSGADVPKDFLKTALIGFCRGGVFSFDGADYVISEELEDGESVINIYRAGEARPYALFTTFSVSRYTGSGGLLLEFKDDVRHKIQEMSEQNKSVATLITKVEKQASDGSVMLDENGNVVYEDTEVTITRKGDNYTITTDRIIDLIDMYAPPMSKTSSHTHIMGTDRDGFDVFARMMYGGRISLVVGFVVVIIEVILGILMGGISGYFGGWVDTLIMRLVEVFYCIPSLPIMIIIGAYLDAEQVNPYVRLVWLMAVLGFLGWASVARLVRGQILSLREQEFMLATEVGGLRVSRRIFRHLIPNVMPQLIVTATAGLGSVILIESTLSFLGLGVKHPFATWGTMINSVSDYNSMVNYTYIWVPVGLLICLTVIAFNFVGDGLRDAFDPKMKS